MLSLLPLIVALATDPSPGPSTQPHPPTPLTEIGRVRALPACTPIVVHANGAITQALDNDRALAILTNNLRAGEYDKLNVIQRRNAIDALTKIAGDIAKNASAGDGEIKRLREYATASKDPQRKAELKAFADALGGALYRQKKAASELLRDVTIVQGRVEAAEAHEIMTRDNPAPDSGVQARTVNADRQILPRPPANWNQTMKEIAASIDDRIPAISYDEGMAADHSIAATSGC
jgi:hypothetical protein